MTLKEFIIKWDNSHSKDFWWRQKHNIAFNSSGHREANQVDITFEYLEDLLSKKVVESVELSEEKKKRLKETGMWIKEQEIDKEKLKEEFDDIDISKL
jgi:hypothetical protein